MKVLPALLVLAGCGLVLSDEMAPTVAKKIPASILELFKTKFAAGTPGKRPQREEVLYTLVEKNDKYEERIYPAWNWVCTDVETGDGIDHTTDFLEIVMYLQGASESGEKMALTAPVMMQRLAAGVAAMCAPLPASHQALLPAPLSPRLRLVAVPRTGVFVRRFGGPSPSRAEWGEQAALLQRHLTEDERHFQPAVIKAMFSDPTQAENRRQEIWLIKA